MIRSDRPERYVVSVHGFVLPKRANWQHASLCSAICKVYWNVSWQAVSIALVTIGSIIRHPT